MTRSSEVIRGISMVTECPCSHLSLTSLQGTAVVEFIGAGFEEAPQSSPTLLAQGAYLWHVFFWDGGIINKKQ